MYFLSQDFALVALLTHHRRTILAAQTVLQGRLVIEKILKGDDDRLLVVVG
jgi:phospho-2-dehydro-3-deoxyheptonate aldolase